MKRFSQLPQKLFILLLVSLLLSACGTSINALVKKHSSKSDNSSTYKAKNFYMASGQRYYLAHLSEKRLKKWFEKQDEYVYVSSEKLFSSESNIAYFYFYKAEEAERVKIENEIKNCEKAVEKIMTKSIMDLCPKLNMAAIQNTIQVCEKCNHLKAVEKRFTDLVPLCLDRKDYIQLFPNSPYSATYQKELEEIKQGTRKGEKNALIEYLGWVIEESQQVPSSPPATSIEPHIVEVETSCIETSNKAYGNISVNSESRWNPFSELGDTDYKKSIVFSDGTSGTLYKDTRGFYIKGPSNTVYYKDYESTLKALYILRKCGEFNPSGRE